MEGIQGVNVLVLDYEKKLIFCVKRGKEDRTFPGMYALPGGKTEAGETLEDAVRREFLEETGCELSEVGSEVLQTSFEHAGVAVTVHVLEGKLGRRISEKLDDDIESAGWITADEFIRSLQKHQYPVSEIEKFRRYLVNEGIGE